MKDYFKRLTAKSYTAWDLNCRNIVPHDKNKNHLERIIKRKARRNDKLSLKEMPNNFLLCDDDDILKIFSH